MKLVKTVIAALALTATCTGLAQAASSANRLAGTDWQVISYNNGKAIYSSLNTENMTVSFSKKNHLSGFAGCNNFMGTYKVPTSQKIVVSPLGSTLMACDKEVAQEEQDFLNAWKKVTTYKIRGSKLTLSDSKGRTVILLQAEE